MEEIDAQLAARVWQRVQGRDSSAATVGDDPAALLFQSHALAGLYLGIQRHFPGKAGSRIRELYHRHRQLMDCLKGICRVDGGAVPGLPPMAAGSGTVQSQLESCFHRERRLADALARQAEGELGRVWQLLAQRAGERCVMVLELLGEEG